MGKLSGWSQVLESTIERGEGLERPQVRKWVGVRGEHMTVQRHHTVDMDGITLTDESEIPDGEAKWRVSTSWGETIWKGNRQEAIDEAITIMRDFYTDKEIEQAKAEIDEDNEFFSQT